MNLKRWILDRRPKRIVECGAGSGELTRQISSLFEIYNFEFHVISDAIVDSLHKNILWHRGLSYEVLQSFDDASIDMCIIDTDHNYWTLMKEFACLFNRMNERGLIALHDVDTFYHDTGMALSYSTGDVYPKDTIESFASNGSLGDAMIEFLHLKRLNYRLLAYTHESQGAALLEKKTQREYAIVVPGERPVYAQNKEVKDAMLQVS